MEENLMNEYRCLNNGEKSEWKQLTSIGEFIWDGVYAIRLVADEPSLGLPFKVNGEEVINLLVNDQFRDNHIQNNRIIVQTLTRVERSTGHVQTYTRSRRYSNGKHKWSEWKMSRSGTNIVNQTDSVVCIMPNEFNIWGEVRELEITLAEPADKSVVNEYMIQFTSGEVATTLILPDNIRWVNNKTPNIVENKVYQISILNGLAVCLEFAN